MMKISKKWQIFSWSMYDFANTIFSMNVISLYFALWVTVDKGGEDIFYSITLSTSMLLASLSAPVLGTMSDKLGKRIPFLVVFTVICCIFTALLGIAQDILTGLVYFFIANYCFQLGDVFYNTLLPEISDREQIGRTSGYGVGLGYMGTIVGLLLTGPFVLYFGRQAAFIPTAIFFFIFALPAFFFVQDRGPKVYGSSNYLALIPEAFRRIKATFVHIRHHIDLFTFLFAAFIILNAVNTVYIFMSVYIKKVIHFSDAQILVFYIISSLFAIGGSIGSGWLSDRISPRKTLSWTIFLWWVTMSLAIFSFRPFLFWPVGALGGISLGSTWTSARILVAQLSPPSMFGEMFGFYGLVGKSAAIIGPLIWGGTILLFEPLGLMRYRIAIFILMLLLGIGWYILQRVPNRGSYGD